MACIKLIARRRTRAFLLARRATEVRVREQPQHQAVRRIGEIDDRARFDVLDPHASFRPRRPTQHGIGCRGKGRREARPLALERQQLLAYAEKALEVRAHHVARRALALQDDALERRQRGFSADHRPGAGQTELGERDLQRRIADEDLLLAAAFDERAQPERQRRIEIPDGVIVETHRRQPRHIAAAHVRAFDRERFAVALVGAGRTLEIDEVLQSVRIERRELHDHAGGQVARVDREIAAPDARAAAERGSDVPNGREMRHLLDRDVEQRLAPAGRRCRLVGREPIVRAAPEAESRVQVRAHEIVLELAGFIERVQDGLTVGQPRRCEGFGHRTPGESRRIRQWCAPRRGDAIRRPAGPLARRRVEQAARPM